MSESHAPPARPALKSRILIGICSCRRHRERRDAIRATWLRRLPENMRAVFFVGRGARLDEAHDDTLRLAAADTYEALPGKVQRFYRAVLAWDFDHLFKCDDDTYLHAERLETLIQPAADMVCNSWWNECGFAQGGAGYLLTRATVRAFATAAIPATGAEDVIFSRTAQALRLQVRATARLHSGYDRVPRADNDQITAHWCPPKTMHTLDAAWQPDARPAGTFRAEHPQWSGEIHFLSNGAFLGGAAHPHGAWQRSGRRLTLAWDHWPPSVLLRDGCGYADGTLRLIGKWKAKPGAEASQARGFIPPARG